MAGSFRRIEVVVTGMLLSGLLSALAAQADPGAISPVAQRVIDLGNGWQILQDVHGSGERLELFRRDTRQLGIGAALSDWEPLPRLTHLQLLFAPQPYFGRNLRWFNQAPWWYRLQFRTPADAAGATLRFEGVDYYAKVWLNGKLLGEHEGYCDPFEFEVGELLAQDQPNLLVVKVSAPWDTDCLPGRENSRVFHVIRSMIKGSYEHADTFVQRDVNSIGIWRPVKLVLHDGLRATAQPAITSRLSADGRAAEVVMSWPVALHSGRREAELCVRVFSEPDATEVARTVRPLSLSAGERTLEAAVQIDHPKLWSTWDRGGPNQYRAEVELRQRGQITLSQSVMFGIRTVALRRTEEETTFLLNGKPIYLRGTTYWPDLYLSKPDRARYERDVAAAVRAGMNALRIHVHVENDELYEICDRLGVLIFQDSDLNWVFPADEAFARRAVRLFEAMIRRLWNHPSVGCWIAMNEAQSSNDESSKVRPGPQLVEAANRLDPTRPVIKNSGKKNDPQSGDGHDYRGSLSRGHYTDIYGSTEKLATEFGMDAPPPAERLREIPRAAELLRDVLPRVAELHDYQYRLIKYYVEHYRMQKYQPNGGYFQFMWIDFCPQSFYGVYDYWGYPKAEGLGGGLRAMEESNQPVGIFMEYKDAPLALHAVNDTLDDLGECAASWRATGAAGQELAGGSAAVRLGADSRARIATVKFPAEKGCRVTLELRSPAGRLLARNVYLDPFNHPPHPKGHPQRMDHELGMRLWWAGEETPDK